MLRITLSEIVRKSEVEAVFNFRDIVVKGLSIDSRAIKKGQGFVAIKGKRFDGHNFLKQAVNKGACFLVVERLAFDIKSFSLPVLLVKDSVRFLGAAGRIVKDKSAVKVAAITGSCGKTTAKDMLAYILSYKYPVLKSLASRNNAIGLPLTLLELNPEHKVCVLEMGSNHFGETEYLSGIAGPDVGVITNLGLAHTEFFKDLRGVYREKISLFRNNSAVAVLNADIPLLRNSGIKNKKIFFGVTHKADIWAEFVKQQDNRVYFRLNNRYLFSLNTLGRFNIYNALAAITAAKVLGVGIKESAGCLSEFSFPGMRFEIKKTKGIVFVNDAYNSNPTAMENFLESAKNITGVNKVGVFGDMLELGAKSGYWHLRILKKALKSGFCCVIITGKNFLKASSNLGRISNCSLIKALRKEDIPKILPVYAKKGSWVFLKASRAVGLEQVIKSLLKKQRHS